ncbi:hypothetical protein H0Z60_10500 [Ectothiorhodospiraceae bacterium WFHF3C12]|nr:hypothetical protein [Ectothiorhodospiraceae bacterium WFHF3C12]
MFSKKILTGAFTLALTVGVAACGGGGGGGDSDGGVTGGSESPEGLWSGTFTERTDSGDVTFDVQGLAYDGDLIMISESAGVVYEGRYSLSGSTLTAQVDAYDNGPIGTATVTAEVDSRSTIQGTFDTSYGTNGSINLGYEPVYDRDVALSDIAANWSGTSGGITTTIAIDSQGNVNGSDGAGCQYNGTAELIKAGKNLFRLSVTASNCGSANGDYSGYAALLDGTSRNSVLQYTLINSSYIIIDYLERQ